MQLILNYYLLLWADQSLRSIMQKIIELDIGFLEDV